MRSILTAVVHCFRRPLLVGHQGSHPTSSCSNSLTVKQQQQSTLLPLLLNLWMTFSPSLPCECSTVAFKACMHPCTARFSSN